MLRFLTPGGFDMWLEEFAGLTAPTPEALGAIGKKYGLGLLPSV